ncbi:MAG: hypothetical protein AB7G80_05365 [Dongiaceae bacterium]
MSHVRIENSKIIVHVPLNLRTWGGKKVIVGPQGKDLRALELDIRKDEKLLKALGRAYRWHGWILTGKYATVQEMSERQKINKSYMQRMMRIMQLSPKIVEAILDGQQPEGFALRDIEQTFSPLWSEQEKQFGFTFPPA